MKYLISIVRFADDLTPETRVVIECESTYTLDNDLVEWVKEEIDTDAQVMHTPVSGDDE